MTFSTMQLRLSMFLVIHLFMLASKFASWGDIINSGCKQSPCCEINSTCSCCEFDTNCTKAICSRRELSQFPDFSQNLVYIDLSFNNIKELKLEATIPDTVEYLDLSYNQIRYIEKDSISRLVNLKYLNLSFNMELNFGTFSNISYGLQFKEIKVLSLNSIHCENGRGITMLYEDFKNINNTLIEDLQLSNNRIEDIEPNVIRSFPKTIRRLDLSNNRFIFGFYWMEFVYLTNLKFINLSSMSSVYGPTSFIRAYCHDKDNKCVIQSRDHRVLNKDIKDSFNTFSTLKKMHFHKRVVNLTLHFPQSVEEVDVSNCFIHYDVQLRNIFFDIPNLRLFYGNGNFVSVMNGTSTITNTTVFADLSYNYCSYVSPRYFENGVSLEQLKLSNNFLGDILEKDSSANVFKSLGKLQNLDLSRNFIVNLSYEVFSPLVQIRTLNLSSNDLASLPLPLDKMKMLTSLDLSDNRIKFFSERNMKELDAIWRIHSLAINLSRNELLCSCETKSFLAWMRDHALLKQARFTGFTTYRCTYTNLTVVSFEHIGKIIDDLTLHCSSDVGIIVSSLLGIAIFTIVLLSCILYRYRWKIRYLYYTTKRAFQVARPGERQLYKYDVFLSYADEERTFVLTELLSALEEHETAVCLHSRDFIPGKPIADNIAAAVHESKYTVCVISKDYLQSYWCLYEFNLAKTETEYARGGDNNIILLMMSDISTRNLPMNILHHIEKESYLEIPPLNNTNLKRQFLERLQSSIS